MLYSDISLCLLLLLGASTEKKKVMRNNVKKMGVQAHFLWTKQGTFISKWSQLIAYLCDHTIKEELNFMKSCEYADSIPYLIHAVHCY